MASLRILIGVCSVQQEGHVPAASAFSGTSGLTKDFWQGWRCATEDDTSNHTARLCMFVGPRISLDFDSGMRCATGKGTSSLSLGPISLLKIPTAGLDKQQNHIQPESALDICIELVVSRRFLTAGCNLQQPRCSDSWGGHDDEMRSLTSRETQGPDLGAYNRRRWVFAWARWRRWWLPQIFKFRIVFK